MTDELRKKISTVTKQLGIGELKTLYMLATRLHAGMTTYAPLDLANDKRDFKKESREERADAAIYDTLDWLVKSWPEDEAPEPPGATPTKA